MKISKGETLFDKMYSIIEKSKKNQEICIQIIEELLKSIILKDIQKQTSIDYVLNMKSLYSTEILNLLAFYWTIDKTSNEFEECKEKLAKKSPFCDITIVIKGKTKSKFKELIDRYLVQMKKQYKEGSYLHQTILQKDRKYLLDYAKLSEKHVIYININIPENNRLLDLHNDFLFTILSTEQKQNQDQIMKHSSNGKELKNMIAKFGVQEIETLLLARSEVKYENLLEQILKKPDNNVDYLLNEIIKINGLETFYTEKMLLMVIITYLFI